MFLKKNSHLALLDVLCPRVDIVADGATASRKKRKVSGSGGKDGAGKDESAAAVTIPHASFQHLTPKDLADPQIFVKAFKEAEANELQVRTSRFKNTVTRDHSLKRLVAYDALKVVWILSMTH